MTQTRKWSLVAIVLVVAVFTAGWFLLVSPKRSDAAELRTQTATAEQANAQLQSKLSELRALAPDLPKREAELAAIRRQIPTDAALPVLIRQLTAAADQSQTTLVSLTPSSPTAVVAAATTPTAAGTTSSNQLMQVSLQLQLTGSYSELEDFIDRLEKLRRAMLVTGFTLGADSGKTGGGMSLQLTGQVFLIDTSIGATTPAAAAAADSGTTASSTTQPAN
jgi:Tfp pilus assembly protein PilO